MNKRALVHEITRKLVDNGQLIEAGWVSFKIMTIQPTAGEDQLCDMRAAFFAGAQHLFGSIMSMLDPGNEPTEKDLRRMQLISSELDAFVATLKDLAKREASNGAD